MKQTKQRPCGLAENTLSLKDGLAKAFGIASCGDDSSKPVAESGRLASARAFVEKIEGVTYLAVDQSNIFVGGRDKAFQVDWSAAKTQLGGDALALAAIVVSQAVVRRPSQDAFFSFLEQTGWQVFRHLAIQNDDGSIAENEQRVDGNVRKLIYEAAESPECDSIVVMSGDGGMTNAVKYARHARKNVFVVAWDGTLHPALAAAATDHKTIDDLHPLIARVMH
jgi:hypothetical protein